MYQRYQPGNGTQSQKQRKPPAGELETIQKPSPRQRNAERGRREEQQAKPPSAKTAKDEKRKTGKGNPVLNIIPSAIYNQETRKVFGLLSAEDLLIVALILLLLDSKESDDSFLVYILLYLLISDYVDLPF